MFGVQLGELQFFKTLNIGVLVLNPLIQIFIKIRIAENDASLETLLL